MNEKIHTLLKDYRKKLERKERAIIPFKEKVANQEDMNSRVYADYKSLETEINMLKVIINDLEYVAEDC